MSGLTDPGSSVDGGAVAKKYSYDVGLVGACRQVKRRLAAYRRRVGTRAVLQQVETDAQVAHERHHV